MRHAKTLLVALLLGAAAAAVHPVAAATAATCTSSGGVSVVVDFRELGGATITDCVPGGGGKTAVEIFKLAGISITYAQSQPGFVCRVNGLPDIYSDRCLNTSPSSAYWGLWWGSGNSSAWTFSSSGVGSLKVPEGGAVGWSWQQDLPPVRSRREFRFPLFLRPRQPRRLRHRPPARPRRAQTPHRQVLPLPPRPRPRPRIRMPGPARAMVASPARAMVASRVRVIPVPAVTARTVLRTAHPPIPPKTPPHNPRRPMLSHRMGQTTTLPRSRANPTMRIRPRPRVRPTMRPARIWRSPQSLRRVRRPPTPRLRHRHPTPSRRRVGFRAGCFGWSLDCSRWRSAQLRWSIGVAEPEDGVAAS